MPPTLPSQPKLASLLRRQQPHHLLPPLLSRALSTTPTPLYKQPNIRPPIPSVSGPEPQIPPYPYGPRQVYKQSNTGLYGNARIQFGHNVSSAHAVKTRRNWKPNIHQKRLWSAALGCFVRTKVSTRVLRTIDKVGGLDEYLLGGKPGRVKELGPWGWRLRWRVMQTEAVRQMYEEQRRELGLPPAGEEDGEEEVIRNEMRAAGVAGEMSLEGLKEEVDAMLESVEGIPLGEEEREFMKEEKPAKE